jgi:hypothetical protein
MTFQLRLLRCSVFDAVGGLDEHAAFAEDYDLCLRLSETTEIAYVPEPLPFYRVHPNSISANQRLQQIDGSKLAIQRALRTARSGQGLRARRPARRTLFDSKRRRADPPSGPSDRTARPTLTSGRAVSPPVAYAGSRAARQTASRSSVPSIDASSTRPFVVAACDHDSASLGRNQTSARGSRCEITTTFRRLGIRL